MENQETIEKYSPQYYVDFNELGNIVGFYVSDIHVEIPESAQPISFENWQLYVNNGPNRYKWDGATIREKTLQELDNDLAILPPAQPSEIDLLRAENIELKVALAELAAAQEADKTEVQLALAELAEIISGGM